MNCNELWGGSFGRASDLIFDNLRFEPHQEHKKNWRIVPSQKCCADLLSVYPTLLICTQKNDHIRTLKIMYDVVNVRLVRLRVWWITEI